MLEAVGSPGNEPLAQALETQDAEHGMSIYDLTTHWKVYIAAALTQIATPTDAVEVTAAIKRMTSILTEISGTDASVDAVQSYFRAVEWEVVRLMLSAARVYEYDDQIGPDEDKQRIMQVIIDYIKTSPTPADTGKATMAFAMDKMWGAAPALTTMYIRAALIPESVPELERAAIYATTALTMAAEKIVTKSSPDQGVVGVVSLAGQIFSWIVLTVIDLFFPPAAKVLDYAAWAADVEDEFEDMKELP